MLDRHEVKFGWFISPYHFSKQRAYETPPTEEDWRLAERYPALFFRDPARPHGWKMVCIKIMVAGSDFWWVHEARVWIPI